MLIIPIWVNNTEVRRIELVRIHPVFGQPEEGEECTYALRYHDGTPMPRIEAIIKHPYLPGNPLPLSILALETIQALADTKVGS